MEDNYIDSWKNKSVFLKQLELNKKELNNNYPSHWYSFINIINSLNENINLLDIGCGVGSYYEICRKHCPNVVYNGIDYSEDAIDIAKKEWNYDNFFIKDVTEIDKDYLKDYNMIHMGALLDVLPNADDILNSILGFGVKYVFISRMEITIDESNYSTYKAYDEITTYRYLHNKDKVLGLIQDNNYHVFKAEHNNILIKIKG